MLWAAYGKLSSDCIDKLSDQRSTLFFSSASIWEIVIKTKLGCDYFTVNVIDLLRGLRMNGYEEMSPDPVQPATPLPAEFIAQLLEPK